MKAYRTSVKIKLGLIVAAVLIAVASLLYTNRLANRVALQEQAAVQLWAEAIEYQARTNVSNPYGDAFESLGGLLEATGVRSQLSDSLAARYAEALGWARAMPPSDELDFVFSEIVEPARFSVPAIITDSLTGEVRDWRNVDVDSLASFEDQQVRLQPLVAKFDEINEPIRFEFYGGEIQYVHYGESELARLIRWFPPIQMGFVALFILVGYLGFSYVRRSEQSSLWVGMAKEAAHQLGTPLSSMMGWIEMLRLRANGDAETMAAADELDRDVERLRRVADRFEKIGSRPKLHPTLLAPVLENVADYVRRRIPQLGDHVTLDLSVEENLAAQLNPDLFEWVIENLSKNALDAIEGDGQISIVAKRRKDDVWIEVRDTGKGIERSAQRHIFRPGFSTKQRGWGLGLSLAKRIVEEYHGGSLTLVDSAPGRGTTFGISLLPAEKPAIGPAEAPR
ncbi:MAG: HAMP domain-containing histidine kinase, partial [Bacteroidetes bacterium]|nr:HAMP domain-containing histidine kinase [Bacteroidota bacterium]